MAVGPARIATPDRTARRPAATGEIAADEPHRAVAYRVLPFLSRRPPPGAAREASISGRPHSPIFLLFRSVTLSGGWSGASLLLGLCVGDIELRTVSYESFKKLQH
uniref:Uncharacterized protein n=1 Tax=Oryza glumipatula TaxID=40148 RepID=A0A0D9YVY6_9ORYZ